MLPIKLLFLFIVTIQRTYSELQHAACQILYDKYNVERIGSRNMLSGAVWPNNIVPYEIGPGFSDGNLDIVKSAMREIESRTCVKWSPRNSEKSYVYISNDKNGCYANLGYNSNRQKHLLNLQKWDGYSSCMVEGIAVHEMFHIMGYAHEQNRPDRDEFVKIHWTRIIRRYVHNFFRSINPGEADVPPICNSWSNATTFDNCYSGYETETFGYRYDYGSIMHYGLWDFRKAKDKVMDTTKRVSPGVKIGQRVKMTDLDAGKVNAKYKCQPASTLFPNSTKSFSTSRTPDCLDISTLCQHLKDKCSFSFMHKSCRRTCGMCPPDQVATATTKPTKANTTAKPIKICFKENLCTVAKRHCT
uniref:Metalloendopeptidase n=1 Tax=Lepeophtheirus salmonis TaxID=72036 RepID=A0A0K2V6N7_LEPSM